jgi:3-phytase
VAGSSTSTAHGRWFDRSPRTLRKVAALVIVSVALLGWVIVWATSDVGAEQSVGEKVPAAGQTDAVAGSGDDADDPAIWHHPSDPHASLILGTNKHDVGGLHVFDVEGDERQFLQTGALNNVDVRYDLDGLGDYAAASNRNDGTITVFDIDDDGVVSQAGAVEVPGEPYGFCLGVLDGIHYAHVTYQSGELAQYALSTADGTVTASLERTVDVGGQLEGCVADDEHGVLYVGEEDRGVYAYGLDPESGDDRLVVDLTGDEGRLVEDVEGLAIYEGDGGGGYLLVSSQGASRIDVYRRGGDHAYLDSFRVVAGDADRVGDTDGIEVTSAVVGRFEHGLLVVHDGDRGDAAASNYKLVAWDDVVRATDLPLTD